MQPYFFPYVGYFRLIAKTDLWVVFDVVQYCRKSWMSRNRIQHPQSGWMYINMPIQHAPQGTKVSKIQLHNMEAGRDKILGQLAHYGKHAPYYHQVLKLVRNAFARAFDQSLCGINIAAIMAVCDYLEIPFDWRRASSLDLDAQKIKHPGHWALQMSEILGAETYLNPVSGKHIFNIYEWHDKGIKIEFMDPPALDYDCSPYVFEPFLSIIDVMMWLPPKTLKTYLVC